MEDEFKAVTLTESDAVSFPQPVTIDSDLVHEGPRCALQVANDMTACIAQYLGMKARYIGIIQNQIVLIEPADPDWVYGYDAWTAPLANWL